MRRTANLNVILRRTANSNAILCHTANSNAILRRPANFNAIFPASCVLTKNFILKKGKKKIVSVMKPQRMQF